MYEDWQNSGYNYCEEDYAVTPRVVEFWNSVLDSLYIIYCKYHHKESTSTLLLHLSHPTGRARSSYWSINNLQCLFMRKCFSRALDTLF